MIVEARKESCSDVDSAFIYIYLTLLNSAYCSLYYRHTHRLTSILRKSLLKTCFYYKFVHVTFCIGLTATNMASVLLLKKKREVEDKIFPRKKIKRIKSSTSVSLLCNR